MKALDWFALAVVLFAIAHCAHEAAECSEQHRQVVVRGLWLDCAETR